MTEEQWDACTDPQKMLKALNGRDAASERKCRLWAAACYGTIWGSNTEPCVRRMVEVAESVADGAATDSERVAAADGLAPILRGGAGTAVHRAAVAAAHLAARRGFTATRVSLHASAALKQGLLFVGDRMTHDEGQLRLAALLRDIFGNPFRPASPIAAGVLGWSDGLIPKLAEAAYQERSLPSGELDRDRLAVLADALEEVGTDDLLLGHLRGPGPRVRGDWVIDLLTGRE
jgi:hypothetical protein